MSCACITRARPRKEDLYREDPPPCKGKELARQPREVRKHQPSELQMLQKLHKVTVMRHPSVCRTCVNKCHGARPVATWPPREVPAPGMDRGQEMVILVTVSPAQDNSTFYLNYSQNWLLLYCSLS